MIYGPLAPAFAVKSFRQAVDLHERPEPVFPALRERVIPHEGERVFPAVRLERGSAAFYSAQQVQGTDEAD